jgi:iron complex outermembrane receptor protein
LQFGNYAARLAGIDGSGRIPLGGNSKAGDFALVGILGYVHGRNTSPAAAGSPGQEPLYHLMPVNAKVGLEHHRGNWSNGVELQAVDAKHDIQAVRLEQTTPGYALVNLRSGYQWHLAERTSLRLDAGIDNVAGHNYVLPLGGRYYGPTMMAIKSGASVPGVGRNAFAGLAFQF